MRVGEGRTETVSDSEETWEPYADWEREEPVRTKVRPKRTEPAAPLEDAEDDSAFAMTYKPSRFEATWLYSSLNSFYQQRLITDVLYHVKGGKEASVYCCVAGPTVGDELLAAKVYRPRRFRNLRNDAMYREGRPVLTADGRPVKATDDRLLRALDKKTEFGVQVQHTSWLMYEFTTLQSLYQAGASVPRPIAAGDNAILMGYAGDHLRAAPTLSEAGTTPELAQAHFDEVIRNIALMLGQNKIHGDLSAYNILSWQNRLTLIDFPQVSDLHANPNAAFILRRDIERVCDFFQTQGVACNPDALLKRLLPNENS